MVGTLTPNNNYNSQRTIFPFPQPLVRLFFDFSTFSTPCGIRTQPTQFHAADSNDQSVKWTEPGKDQSRRELECAELRCERKGTHFFRIFLVAVLIGSHIGLSELDENILAPTAIQELHLIVDLKKEKKSKNAQKDAESLQFYFLTTKCRK